MDSAKEQKAIERLKSWQTGQDVFRWWLGEDFNQLTFDDLEV